MRRFVLSRFFLFLLGGAWLPMTAPAAPPGGVVFTQLTHGGCFFGSSYPSVNASADQVAFESDCNLTGANADGSKEVFLMNTDGSGLVQLTNSNTYSNNGSLNASGKKVVFSSFADLIPGQNADNNSDVFTINADGSDLQQVTFSTGGVFVGAGFLANHSPKFDYSGKHIFFTSKLDLVPGQNADGSKEVFMVNADGTGLAQLTSGGTLFRGSGGAAPDASGQRFAFSSKGELFLRDVDGSNLIQLTSGVGANDPVGLDAAARTVVLSSNDDVVVGGNSDGNSEIYLLEVKTGQIRQITDTTGGRGCFGPSIAADGKTLAFACDRDLVPGLNVGLNQEVFLANIN